MNKCVGSGQRDQQVKAVKNVPFAPPSRELTEECPIIVAMMGAGDMSP